MKGCYRETPSHTHGAIMALASRECRRLRWSDGGNAKRKADKERKAKEKAAKAAEKAARQAERTANAAKKAGAENADANLEVPTLTLRNYESATWGDLFIQSHAVSGRTWNAISGLKPSLAGTKVWIRARVATSRKQGKMLCFLQLRQSMRTVQAVVFSKDSDIVAYAASLPKESVVDIYGELTVPKEPIASCTASAIELAVKKLFCVSRSLPELPLQLDLLLVQRGDLAHI